MPEGYAAKPEQTIPFTVAAWDKRLMVLFCLCDQSPFFEGPLGVPFNPVQKAHFVLSSEVQSVL
jgi:hypothetical protein